MIAVKSTGRWIGAAILAGYVFGMGSNFFLQPMLRQGEGPLGLLGGAAAQPDLVGAIVLLGMIAGVLGLTISALLCQLSLNRPYAWLAFLGFGIEAASFALGGQEYASYQLYRALGDVVTAAPGGGLAVMIDPVFTLVTEQRRALHYVHLFLSGTGLLGLYVLLFKARYIPRWLGLAGIGAAMLQMAGILSGIFGHEISFYFLAPLALVQLGLGLWLVTVGFAEERLAQ